MTDRPGHDGAVSSGSALRYVAIGDSLPRGFLFERPIRQPPGPIQVRWSPLLSLFDHPARGYPELVRQRLAATGLQVRLDNTLTCTGAPVRAFWDRGPVRDLQRVLAGGADIITLTVGANDILPLWAGYALAATAARGVPLVSHRRKQSLLDRVAPSSDAAEARLQTFEARLSDLLGWLRVTSGDARIVLTTYYNPDGSSVVHERFVTPLNTRIRRVADAVPGTRVVELDPLFDGHRITAPTPRRWISGVDGLHPTDAGQAVIATAVAAAITGERLVS